MMSVILKKFHLAKSFTLIELLIVIAIILILIAIALPNFLEAQIRAKVVRVKGEFRSIETALESFGPDLHDNGSTWSPVIYKQAEVVNHFTFYSPTNGTTSEGDINKFGGFIPPAINQYSR
jgi:prepilin-type N-terminal cleavage/methylation domain-containing protein